MVTWFPFSARGAVVAEKIGSRDHRDLMCGEFERTFRSYEVKDIVWPELSPDELARLREMPFWGEALETEQIATKRIRQMVETEPDPSCAMRSRCRHTWRAVTPSSSRA